jgi:hypothetical protein
LGKGSGSAFSGTEAGEGVPFSRARPDLLQALAVAGGGNFVSGADAGSLRILLDGFEAWGGGTDGVEVQEVAVEAWPWLVILALVLLSIETSMEFPGRRRTPC